MLLFEHDWHLSAEESMSRLDDVRAVPTPTAHGGTGAMLEELFATGGVNRVGVADDRRGEFRSTAVDRFPEGAFIDGQTLWLAMVISPSPYDRSMIERAGAIADRGIAGGCRHVNPGSGASGGPL